MVFTVFYSQHRPALFDSDVPLWDLHVAKIYVADRALAERAVRKALRNVPPVAIGRRPLMPIVIQGG